jgi:hypothetical protein
MLGQNNETERQFPSTGIYISIHEDIIFPLHSPSYTHLNGRGMMEEVNSTMIHCKNFCKCYNVPPENDVIIKKLTQLKKK